MNDLKIFAGQSNEKLAMDIADWINLNCSTKSTVLGKLDSRRKFSDGELYVRYDESVRDLDVFIIQSTNQPDSNLLELLFMISAAKKASARRVTAVMPYFGYARQDKQDKSREVVSVEEIARYLEVAGADRVILLDVHSNATNTTLRSRDIQVDHIWARSTMAKYLIQNENSWRSSRDLVIMAPDVHAGNLAKKYAKNLKAKSIAFIHKERPEPGKSQIVAVIGEVNGCDVLIVDDLIDTFGTIDNAGNASKERGAENVFALGTHGLFSGEALDRVHKSVIQKVFTTDSIYHPNVDFSIHPKIEKISVVAPLAETICRTHKGESVSSLFENE